MRIPRKAQTWLQDWLRGTDTGGPKLLCFYGGLETKHWLEPTIVFIGDKLSSLGYRVIYLPHVKTGTGSMDETFSTLADHLPCSLGYGFEFRGLDTPTLMRRLEGAFQHLHESTSPLYVLINGLGAIGERHWDNGVDKYALTEFLSFICKSTRSSSVKVLVVTNGLPKVLVAHMFEGEYHGISHLQFDRKLSSLQFPQAAR